MTSTLPQTGRLEVAFAGKSNVGKSSLINGLMNRKALARTSSEPGKTQTINFYNVNDVMYLVDLPGYGFARVSKEESARWERRDAQEQATPRRRANSRLQNLHSRS